VDEMLVFFCFLIQLPRSVKGFHADIAIPMGRPVYEQRQRKRKLVKEARDKVEQPTATRQRSNEAIEQPPVESDQLEIINNAVRNESPVVRNMLSISDARFNPRSYRSLADRSLLPGPSKSKRPGIFIQEQRESAVELLSSSIHSAAAGAQEDANSPMTTRSVFKKQVLPMFSALQEKAIETAKVVVTYEKVFEQINEDVTKLRVHLQQHPDERQLELSTVCDGIELSSLWNTCVRLCTPSAGVSQKQPQKPKSTAIALLTMLVHSQSERAVVGPMDISLFLKVFSF